VQSDNVVNPATLKCRLLGIILEAKKILETMMTIKEVMRTSIMEKVESKTLKQREANEVLGLSLRHTQRLICAYRDEGSKGLISKKRGKPNPERISLEK